MLQEQYVRERGIKCILATHSPTTVAFAPENSVYEMIFGETQPRFIEKQAAIGRLTAGIPTLAIDYSGRRYVFTESNEDAPLYDKLWSSTLALLDFERTLVFTSSGIAKRGTSCDDTGEPVINTHEINAGCAAVTKIVRSFDATANHSIFGIVDWDNKRQPESHIHVLGFGTHYTLENVLLDPLLVGCLMTMEFKLQDFGHDPIKLATYRQLEMQALANLVAHDTLGFEPGGEEADARYLNGWTIRVPAVTQRMKGHDYEKMIADKLPWLKGGEFNRYSPKHWVVNRVISAMPKLCPLPIVEAFRGIVEA